LALLTIQYLLIKKHKKDEVNELKEKQKHYQMYKTVVGKNMKYKKAMIPKWFVRLVYRIKY